MHAVAGGDFLAGDRTDYFGNMGWAVGQLYTAKYFPPSAKAKIEALVLNLKAAFRGRIEKLDWMSPAAKKKAPAKKVAAEPAVPARKPGKPKVKAAAAAATATESKPKAAVKKTPAKKAPAGKAAGTAAAKAPAAAKKPAAKKAPVKTVVVKPAAKKPAAKKTAAPKSAAKPAAKKAPARAKKA